MRFSKFRQTAGLSNTLRVITTLVFIIIMSVSSSVWAQNNDSKVIILSIDGMPDYILDKLIAEGRVPNIARLAQNGVRAERMITSFPAETTVAHPVIWTGADPWDNGIPGEGVSPCLLKKILF